MGCKYPAQCLRCSHIYPSALDRYVCNGTQACADFGRKINSGHSLCTTGACGCILFVFGQAAHLFLIQIVCWLCGNLHTYVIDFSSSMYLYPANYLYPKLACSQNEQYQYKQTVLYHPRTCDFLLTHAGYKSRKSTRGFCTIT